MSGRIFQLNNLVRASKSAAIKLQKITDEDAKDPAILSRVINKITEAASTLQLLARPGYIEFEDQAATVGGTLTLPHNFSGRVRWWVTDWSVPSGTAAPSFRKTTATTADVLVLDSNALGTATIRVEALP